MEKDEMDFLDSCGIRPIEKIAHGAFGEVWKVYSFQYKSNFALKKIPQNKYLEGEIECMKSINACFIVNLYNYYVFNGYIYMLMELCVNDLERFIAQKGTLTTPEIRKVIQGCIGAVKACHDRSIAHCDIKPSNFLFDKYDRIKLGDFGLAHRHHADELSDNFRGTKVFMAPEIFRKIEFDPFKADIWALGVTIYFVATGMYPFMGNDSRMLYERISSGIYNPEPLRDHNLIKLVRRCLDINPANRATVDELLGSPYFLRQLPTGKSTIIKQSMSQSSRILLSERICRPRVRRSSYNQSANNSSCNSANITGTVPDVNSVHA